MFCIHHKACPKSGDNGNCTVYAPCGVASVNRGRVCGVLPVAVDKKPHQKVRVGQQKQKA